MKRILLAWCAGLILAGVTLHPSKAIASASLEPDVSRIVQSYVMRLRDALAQADPLKSDLARLFDEGRLLSNRPGAVVAFRESDDLELIAAIVEAVSTGARETRVNGSLLLATIVDNTTLCAVLQAASEAKLDVNARFNFLQIARVVGTYATEENADWIRGTIAAIRNPEILGTDSAKTEALMDSILTALGTQQTGSFRERFSREYYKCIALPFITKLELARQPVQGDNPLRMEWKNYRVFLHSKRPAAEVQALKARLLSMGFSVGGEDEKTDDTGGPGVDFQAADPSGAYLAAASVIANAVKTVTGSDVPPRRQSKIAERSFGVWF